VLLPSSELKKKSSGQRRNEHSFLNSEVFESSDVYLWLYSSLWDLGHFFSFFIFYTVGRTPWTGDQLVARPLPAHRTAETG
jgi:hypothetical protein